jgi:hypothetical protein
MASRETLRRMTVAGAPWTMGPVVAAAAAPPPPRDRRATHRPGRRRIAILPRVRRASQPSAKSLQSTPAHGKGWSVVITVYGAGHALHALPSLTVFLATLLGADVELPAGFMTGRLEGGSIEAREWGHGCTGFVSAEPDHEVMSASTLPYARFVVNGGALDTTLVLQLSDGTFRCNDDGDGRHPQARDLRHVGRGRWNFRRSDAVGVWSRRAKPMTTLLSLMTRDHDANGFCRS